MGLQQKQGGNYITILGGKFCQRVPEGTEGAQTRTNKVGKVVHEKFYDSFVGKLVGIEVRDGNYGKTWNFDFQDKEDVYTLQLPYSGSYSGALLKILPNIDLTKEVEVVPSVKEDNGKTRRSLFVIQNGNALKHAYTRENPNGLPDMEQVTVNGNQVWDDTKRLAFLEKMVRETIIPKLTGTTPVETKPSGLNNTASPVATEANEEEVDLENLPF